MAAVATLGIVTHHDEYRFLQEVSCAVFNFLLVPMMFRRARRWRYLTAFYVTRSVVPLARVVDLELNCEPCAG